MVSSVVTDFTMFAGLRSEGRRECPPRFLDLIELFAPSAAPPTEPPTKPLELAADTTNKLPQAEVSAHPPHGS